MKRIWSYIKTFHPPLVLSCILSAIFAVLSLISVTTDLGERFPAVVTYGVYVCAAISLTLAVWAIIRLCHEASPGERILTLVHKTDFTSRLVDDYSFRTISFTYLSFGLNVIFALAKGVSGLFSASWWLISLSAYYIILCAAKLMLLRNRRKLDAEKSQSNRMEKEWKAYRICGALLIGMTLIMAGVVIMIMIKGNHFTYYGVLIFIVALWDFYCFISAVVYIARNRKNHTPIIVAIKRLGFAKAMVSMLSLQTAMFASFDDGMELKNQNFMNLLTGSAVCLILLSLGVTMVIQASKKISKLKAENTTLMEELS